MRPVYERSITVELYDTSAISGTEISRLISMAGDITAKRSMTERVRDRVRRKVCLVCESEAWRRGLCSRHYQKFQRLMRNKPRRERPQFEIVQIKEGRLLASNQVREICADNPFEGD